MPVLLCQPTSTISQAIDDSRTVAKRCTEMAFLVRLFAEPDAVAPKNPNVPNRVSEAVADLGHALGDASDFSAVEHWFTRSDPVEFAGVHGGNAHGVALELASRIHRAAARAIEQVHDEDTVRKLQQKPAGRWRWEDDGSSHGLRVRSWRYSPFIVTYQTDSHNLLEAWRVETWDAVRASLSQQPLFDLQRLLGMIDCEWGRVKQSFETRLQEADQLRCAGSSCDSRGNGVGNETTPPAVIISEWGKPVIVLGNPKHLEYLEWKVIRALFDAGPEGLNQNEIEDVVASAREIIRKLRARDEHWRAVIEPAKKRGGRYRLLVT